MPLPEKRGHHSQEDDGSYAPVEAESMSRLQSGSNVSDVRALSHGNEESLNEPNHTVTKSALVPPPLGLLRLLDELETYTDSLPLDTAFWAALRSGDSSSVMKWLLTENARLVRELSAATADFDELKRMNVSNLEQLSQALEVSDDNRLALASELEIAKDRIVQLEEEIHEMTLRIELEVERHETDCEAFELEIAELRQRLAT
jgi:hypothetical protein